ncbi:WXG100 family type VII secretion target [Rhodococcus sp. 27YEA15]|uniref:WXG100 family type VII secretion target n=1 Tax=Rhodococcus sp. 27YEA15 TaxID=3156259 RepID=UPI003C7C07A6
MGFTATPSELTQSANSIDNHRGVIQSVAASVRAEAEGSHGMWKGVSQATYMEIMTRYDAATKKLDDALTDICNQVKLSAGDFVAVEEENVAGLNRAVQGGGSINML